MSLTTTVPAVVPSLFHSSAPLTGSLAVKNSVLPMTVRLKGLELALPGRMSLTRTVPADGARGGAVALPEFPAVGPVVGDEVERPAEIRQVFGVRPAAAGADVLDKRSAGSRPFGLPELAAVLVLARREEDRVADRGDLPGVRRFRAGVDVLEQLGDPGRATRASSVSRLKIREAGFLPTRPAGPPRRNARNVIVASP
jgi:hypothetical protein